MVYEKLIQKIESNSLEMARKWAQGILKSDFTKTYRQLPEHKLIQLSKNVYDNLGRWLDQTDFHPGVEKIYASIGRERYQQGYPLCEIVFALHFTKKILTDFISSQGLLPDAVNLYYSMDFLVRIYKFFDFAAFYLAKGYHHALYQKVVKLKRLSPQQIGQVFPSGSLDEYKKTEIKEVEKMLDGFNLFKLK